MNKEITISIPDNGGIENADRANKLQVIARLPKEDFDRVAQLAKNRKALDGLKKHWTMLKAMF